MRKTKKGGSLLKKLKNTTRKLFKKEKRDFSFYMCGDDTDDPEEFLKYLSKIPKQKYILKTIKLEKKQESILNTSELENQYFTSNNGGRAEFKSGDIQKIQNRVPSFETIHIATSFDPIHAAQAIIFLLLTSNQNIDIIYIHLSPFLGVKMVKSDNDEEYEKYKNIEYYAYCNYLKENLAKYLVESQVQKVKTITPVNIHICIQKEKILELKIKDFISFDLYPVNNTKKDIKETKNLNLKSENKLFAKTVRKTEKDALKFIKETNNKDITQVFTSQHSMNKILDKFNTYVDERTRIKMMKKIFKFFIKFKIQNCLFSKLDITYDSNNILIKQDTQQNGFDRVFCMTNQLNPNIAKIMYQNLHYAFFNIPRTVSFNKKLSKKYDNNLFETSYIQYINVDDVYTGDIAKGYGGKRSELYLLPDPNSNYFKKHIKLFFKDEKSNRDINQIAYEIMEKKDKIYYKNMKNRLKAQEENLAKDKEVLEALREKLEASESLIQEQQKKLELKESELFEFYENNTLNKDTLEKAIEMNVGNYSQLCDEMLSNTEKKNLNSYITDMNEDDRNGDEEEINKIYKKLLSEEEINISHMIDEEEMKQKIYFSIRKRTESSDYYRYAIPLLFLIYGKSL